MKVFHNYSITEEGSKMAKLEISNKIRKLRFDNDEMTQQELAKKAGITRQTIVAIEKGKYSPSLELAFRLANVFAKPLEEVFSYQIKEDKKQEKKK